MISLLIIALISSAVGIVAAKYLALADVVTVSSDLVQVFVLLAALLAQLIALLATIFQPGRLGLARIQEINAALGRLQMFNIGLLVVYIASIAVWIAIKILGSHQLFASTSFFGMVSLAQIVIGVAGFLVVFSILRTLQMLRVIVGLQALRAEQVELEARAVAEQAARIAVSSFKVEDDPTADRYGRSVDFPANPDRR
jgi:hypothetical protein